MNPETIPPNRDDIDPDDRESVGRIVQQAALQPVSVRADVAQKIGVFVEDAITDDDAEIALQDGEGDE